MANELFKDNLNADGLTQATDTNTGLTSDARNNDITGGTGGGAGQNAPFRTMVDGNQDVFKYGITRATQDSAFEDPTLLGFTIELDEQSALFTQVLPFLEKHAPTRTEMQSRISVYKEFVSKIRKMFNSQDSVRDAKDKAEFTKQHYINSISGMDNLSKKFIKWREDKLSIELYEDISLFTSYITHLYNNLIYSYENGRMIIPENLLKFNMYIRISEIRNLTSIGFLKNGQNTAKGLKNDITCIVYKLYDCEFDFFNSRPFQDNITQAGIDATFPATSIVNMDLYFKSVARQIFNPLVTNALSMNDNKVDLDVKIVGDNNSSSTNGQQTQDNTTQVNSGNVDNETYTVSVYNQEAFLNQPNKKPTSFSTYNIETQNNKSITEPSDLTAMQNAINEIKTENKKDAPLINPNKSPLSPQDLLDDPTKLNDKQTNNIKDDILNIGKKGVNAARTAANRELLRKRNELIRTFRRDVISSVNIKNIIPANVYTDGEYYKQILGNIASELGNDISNELLTIVQQNVPNFPKL